MAVKKVSAMDVRKDFGELVDEVLAGDVVFVTRHDRAVLVMVSPRTYNELIATKEGTDA